MFNIGTCMFYWVLTRRFLKSLFKEPRWFRGFETGLRFWGFPDSRFGLIQDFEV